MKLFEALECRQNGHMAQYIVYLLLFCTLIECALDDDEMSSYPRRPIQRLLRQLALSLPYAAAQQLLLGPFLLPCPYGFNSLATEPRATRPVVILVAAATSYWLSCRLMMPTLIVWWLAFRLTLAVMFYLPHSEQLCVLHTRDGTTTDASECAPLCAGWCSCAVRHWST